MFSVDEYNKITNENTAGRTSGDQSFHEAMAEKADQIAKQPKPDENPHACMIIGYNEKTEELAVSDSWGNHFELRWVTLKAADWVSHNSLFMILP